MAFIQKKLSSFQSEPELTQISLEGEQGANYEDQLSNKMGEGLLNRMVFISVPMLQIQHKYPSQK